MMAVSATSLIKRALLSKRRQDLLRDERGATLIEFGLLALPFFAIIGAIVETAMVFLSGQLLDSGVQDTSRLIRTGQAKAANYTLVEFREALCDRLLNLFDCSKLHIEVQALGSFNAASITAPIDFNCTDIATCVWKSDRPEVYAPGAGSSITVVQVYYKWPVILSFGNMTFANLATNERVLGSAAVFSNEPFQ